MEEGGDGFKFRHPVEVRFKDVDVGGHAHHSHALVYFEEARWAYWMAVVAPAAGGAEAPATVAAAADVHYILAEATVRWHKRVFWPMRLDVGVRVARLGKKHFEMEYEARSPEGERLISGRSVQVWYDYQAKQTARIPGVVRAAIEAVDGPLGHRRQY